MSIDVFAYGSILFCGLLALSIIDFRTLRLPDFLTFPLVIAGLIFSFWQGDYYGALFGAVAGYAVLAILEIVYKRLRGRDGLGRGDAKLLAAGGAWCSVTGLPFILLIASGTGLIYALILSLKSKNSGGPQPHMIPFGPFLSLGIFVTWLVIGAGFFPQTL